MVNGEGNCRRSLFCCCCCCWAYVCLRHKLQRLAPLQFYFFITLSSCRSYYRWTSMGSNFSVFHKNHKRCEIWCIFYFNLDVCVSCLLIKFKMRHLILSTPSEWTSMLTHSSSQNVSLPRRATLSNSFTSCGLLLENSRHENEETQIYREFE